MFRVDPVSFGPSLENSKVLRFTIRVRVKSRRVVKYFTHDNNRGQMSIPVILKGFNMSLNPSQS